MALGNRREAWSVDMALLVELPVAFGVRINRWLRRLKDGWRSNAEVFPLHSPGAHAPVVALRRAPHQSVGAPTRPDKSSRAVRRTHTVSIPADRHH